MRGNGDGESVPWATNNVTLTDGPCSASENTDDERPMTARSSLSEDEEDDNKPCPTPYVPISSRVHSSRLFSPGTLS